MNDPADQQHVIESHSEGQIVGTGGNCDKISQSLIPVRKNAVFAIESNFMPRLVLAALIGVAFGSSVYAQQSDPFAPAQRLADGWEQMDQRLVFLMVRLVDVEANLDAVDAAIAKAGGRAASARSTANRAEAGSDRMDRRAGGPVRWDKFYGTTAEKFFYHPTQNHTYHTETILSHQSPSNDNQSESGVPSRQGLPVHQRPPQFDYMYRANENAKERATADVAKIANKVEALAARRAELELEQSKLWCEVAFRVVSRNDLDKKPLYRFMPKGSGQESLTAAASFVVVALSVVKSGESDQGGAFRQIKPMVSKARSDLGDKWLQLGVDYRDQSSTEWKFASLARYLEDVSSNLSDSYSVSIDSARNSDNDRRDMYRGLLQKSLVQYAEAVLALNEMASEMAIEKGFEPELGKPIVFEPSPKVPFISGKPMATNAFMSEPANSSPRNGSMADLLSEETTGEAGTAYDLKPSSAEQNRMPKRRQRLQTVQYIFNEPNAVSANWKIAGNFQVEGGGLRIYGGAGHKQPGEPGGVSLLESKRSISGDGEIQIAYSMSKDCQMIVHVWNQTFEFSATGQAIARLQRDGNKVVTMNGNNQPRTVFLKDENLDSSEPISIHMDRRNLSRPAMELQIKAIAVKSATDS